MNAFVEPHLISGDQEFVDVEIEVNQADEHEQFTHHIEMVVGEVVFEAVAQPVHEHDHYHGSGTGDKGS